VHTDSQEQVNRTVPPVSLRRTVTVQRASADDQSAETTWWWRRILSRTPYSSAVSSMYRRIDGPSAIAFESFQGRKA
jgi:hypothetical protein